MKKRLYKSITLTGFTLLIIYIGLKTYQLMTSAAGWYSPTKLLLLLIGFEIGLLLIWMAVFIYLFLPDCYAGWEKRIIKFREKNTYISWSLVTFFIVLPSFLIFFSSIFNLQTMEHKPILFPQYRLIAYLLSNVITAIFLTRDHRKLVTLPKLTLAFLFSGFVFVLTVYYHNVVTYPFSLSWSEGNLIWDYSLLFGEKLYVHPLDQPITTIIDSGRQVLFGLPFLIPEIPIWGMRLWNAVLFTFPYVILGFLLFYSENNRSLRILMGMWTLLFLNQGPIWTPLVICAILIAACRDIHIFLGIILVCLAGFYAQLTRFTWAFAPAMWVGMWTLGKATLEKNVISKKIWVRAITLVISGLIGGVILPLALKTNQNLTAGGMTAAVTQHPLIWSRLWPNPTYPPGIVFGLMMAVFPVLVIVGYLVYSKIWKPNIWQSLVMIFGMFAFFVVGLIVSLKMGGGSNIHNLDMFLIGLLFVVAMAWEKGGSEWIQIQNNSLGNGYFLLLAVLLPIVHPLVSSEPLYLPNKELTQISLTQISNRVSEAAGKGEVLFMDQRQLLTFGYFDKIPFVDEYEKRYMMDEVMASNEAYFKEFYQDLKTHRFSLIVSQPTKIGSYIEGEHNFGLEHNAWLEWVDEPLLCYYQQEILFKIIKVELLVPREEPCKDADQYE